MKHPSKSWQIHPISRLSLLSFTSPINLLLPLILLLIVLSLSSISLPSLPAILINAPKLKLFVHPLFHCPSKPQLLSQVVLEYSEKTRGIARKLVEAVSESLGLDQSYVDEALGLDSSFQIFAANYYPPCPQPDQAIGLPTHTDPGLFTLLIHNGVPGLQIEHDGHWFDASAPTNSIMVIVPDQLHIFSNGRCKSLKHRAVVNEHRERISVVVANGPSKEAVVGPAAPLVERDGRALYRSAKYEEYLESQLTKPRFNGRSILDEQMIFD